MEVKKVKRKTILVLTLGLLTLLSASSLTVIAHAWLFQKPKSEYVGYSLELINYEGALTHVDSSGAPNLIFEGVSGALVECTVTIADTVYTYPDDFNYNHSYHLEFNALTGEGFARSKSVLTFNGHKYQTITIWAVSRVSGLRMYANGTYVAPEEVKYEGKFELSGTQSSGIQGNYIEGFGLDETHLIPPTYTQNYIKQMGYIKGWPL
ncbi:MAG: hypothetical protein CW716_07515 [Candidatus Bathyarchaeum sp.]|nr:MAG: hypothetical protein CW716_07515 [Candidatus Bathyarchaeum sp.]